MERPEPEAPNDDAEEFEAGSAANPPRDEFPSEEDARTDLPGVPEEAEDLQDEV